MKNSGRILVISSGSVDNPVLLATTGRHLSILRTPPNEVWLFGRIPGTTQPPFASRVVTVPKWAAGNLMLFVAMSALLTLKARPRVVVCRDDLASIGPSLVPKRWRRWTLVCDKRGIAAAESAMKSTRSSSGKLFPRMRSLTLRRLESVAVKRADSILTVSHQMKTYLRTRYSSLPIINIVPNGVDFSEAQRRLRADNSDRGSESVVIAYVGGGGVWQEIDETLKLIVSLQESDPRFHGLVASTDVCVQEKARRAGVHEVISPRFNQIWSTYSRTDFTVLLRSDHLVNHVASPIKLGESLAAGSPIIATQSSWEGIESMSREDLAIIIDLPITSDKVERVLLQMRRIMDSNRSSAVRDAAMKYLDLRNFEDVLASVYRCDKQ